MQTPFWGERTVRDLRLGVGYMFESHPQVCEVALGPRGERVEGRGLGKQLRRTRVSSSGDSVLCGLALGNPRK